MSSRTHSFEIVVEDWPDGAAADAARSFLSSFVDTLEDDQAEELHRYLAANSAEAKGLLYRTHPPYTLTWYENALKYACAFAGLGKPPADAENSFAYLVAA